MTDGTMLEAFQWRFPFLDAAARMGEHGFTHYAFYQRVDRRRKLFRFSCCGETALAEKGAQDHQQYILYNTYHKNALCCPFCGQMVVACCVGRIRGGQEGDYPSLRENRNVAFLDDWQGGLLVSAGRLRREWVTGDEPFAGWPDLDFAELYPWPEPTETFFEWRRYAIAPGRVQAWTKREIWESNHQVGHEWIPVKRPGRRIFHADSLMAHDPEDGCYTTIGTGAVAHTELKYCAVERYLDDWEDGVYGRQAVGYLMEYARHPQLEMLTRLGHGDVIYDLLARDECHRDLLNWRATQPNEFFRLSKGDYRAFRDAGGTLDELRQVQDANRFGVTPGAFFAEKRRLTAGIHRPAKEEMHTCGELAQICGVSLHTAVSYAIRNGGTGLWKDYIHAAQTLDYDLQRQDVSMPKDLRRRHDEATATVKTEGDRILTEAYQKTILPALRRRYEFTYDGLTVLVPLNAEEIVAEGKAMQHCVGGYAARHMKGRVTILFLRQTDHPETPFVTIEMNGDRMIQARGFRNDIGAGSTPQTRHPAFFRVWLDWVGAGSPRMANGTPKLRTTKTSKKEDKTA